MEVPAFDVTFDNDVRGRIDSAHTHFDNDTALVTSTENFTSVYFINHAYDVGVVLSIGEDVEIDHGKVPVHVYGDGGNIASYAKQYQEYRAYATVRPSTVAATPEPATWAWMIARSTCRQSSACRTRVCIHSAPSSSCLTRTSRSLRCWSGDPPG